MRVREREREREVRGESWEVGGGRAVGGVVLLVELC